jgi:hypothetical protein
MQRKPSIRLYRIEIKLITYSLYNYFDTKHSFIKNMEELKNEYKNVVGYKRVNGNYILI